MHGESPAVAAKKVDRLLPADPKARRDGVPRAAGHGQTSRPFVVSLSNHNGPFTLRQAQGERLLSVSLTTQESRNIQVIVLRQLGHRRRGIRIPAQAFESRAQDTFCDNLSYTPWHALPEERPVGGINRLRKEVYAAISALRHKLNKAPSVEPTGDETFE